MLIVCKDGAILYKDLVHPRALISIRIQEPVHNKYQKVMREHRADTGVRETCPVTD